MGQMDNTVLFFFKDAINLNFCVVITFPVSRSFEIPVFLFIVSFVTCKFSGRQYLDVELY